MKALARLFGAVLAVAMAPLVIACSDTAGSKAGNNPKDGGTDPEGGVSFDQGEELKVPVPETGRVYVKLASPPALVTPADPKTDKGWDIAFEGLDIFTNSGPSGSGLAQAFGPLDAIVFLDDVAPTVPFLTGDKAGGAFIRWWYYEGAPTHALHSRYHLYGVKDGTRQWKVQVLAYYGERDGAPVSALYRVRWSEVTAQGSGPVQELTNVDGTAGGPSGAAEAPSECIDLGTAARVSLSPSAARLSNAWHICFRRQDISVNGEIGGPRNVGAVDLDADKTAKETLPDIVNKTPESERARFDAIDAQALAGQQFRGDRIVSAFSGLWIERGSSPPAPGKFAWLVVGANSTSKYLLGFPKFEGSNEKSPGTVVMRVKSVK